MKNLLIIRHAIALKREDWNERGKSDFTRPLSKRGIEKFKKSLPGLKKLVPQLDVIYTSEFVRAHDTAQLLGDYYDLKLRADGCFNHGKMPREMCKEIKRLAAQEGPAQTIALVGHEPELCILIHLLTGLPLEDTYLKKGGAALIENPSSTNARLRWLKKPRELRGADQEVI